MERKPTKHARTRSSGGSTGAGGVLASFLRSTAASFSSSTTANFAARGNGHAHAKPSFNHRNAFSGPMVSIVPPEARGRKAGGGKSGYRTPEASSPKVSCIGQIKRSKSKTKARCKATRKAAKSSTAPVACGMDGGACPLPPRPQASKPRTTPSSLVRRMLFRRTRSRSSSSLSSCKPVCSASVAAAPAAGLGQMKRFTSGRAALQDFDWTAEDHADGRRASDADGYGYGSCCDDDDDDRFVAFSAPLVLGGGVVASEPRKEVNLWRRRPMSPPTPLQLP